MLVSRILFIIQALDKGRTLEVTGGTPAHIAKPNENHQQLYLPGVKTAQHSRFLQFLIRRQKHSALREARIDAL